MNVETPLPPRPIPDADTQSFWDAVAARRLLIPRCGVCDRWIWQPRPVCPSCRAPAPVWTEVSGSGRIASWTVIHPPVLPVWAERVPFVVVLVELDEGVRLIGQLVDGDGTLLQTNGEAEGIAMGARVALRWREEAGITLPVWTLEHE